MTHWLQNAAVRAGIPGAAEAVVAPTASVAQAWDEVSRGTQLSGYALASKVATALRLPLAYVEQAEAKAARLLPEKLARKYGVFALRDTDRELIVASSDPNDYEAERDIGFASGRRVKFELAPPSAIQEALDGAYSGDTIVANLLNAQDTTLADAVRVLEEVEPEQVTAQDVDATPLVKLTNLILSDAVTQRA